MKSDLSEYLESNIIKKNHYSLGFVFNYLETDTLTMHYNLRFTNEKDEQIYFTSLDMNFIDMKEKMKSINQEFIGKSINELDENKGKKLKF